MNIAIIGGGAAGIFCATKLSKHFNVTIYEKNASLGKKLLITGSGRCNVTNLKFPVNFLQNVIVNSKFLYSSLHQFTPHNLVEWLTQNNIELTEEEDNKIYPKQGRATAILNCLKSNLSNNVTIKTLTTVNNIEHKNNKFYITASNQTSMFDKLIIATGGKSYPITGSTGDGYTFAKQLGHTITTLRQSLCGFVTDKTIVQHCSGVSFSCSASIVNQNNEIICHDKGNVMLTHFGVSGPLTIKLSSMFLPESIENYYIMLDMLPECTHLQLKEQLNNFIKRNAKKQIFEFLEPFLVKRFAQTLKETYNNLLTTQCAQMTNEKKEEVVRLLKNLQIKILNFDSFERSVITRGGVNVNEVNPKSMESKIVSGLYFIGEVLNVDALTGGYNLQIAFSTAYACANQINENSNI